MELHRLLVLQQGEFRMRVVVKELHWRRLSSATEEKNGRVGGKKRFGSVYSTFAQKRLPLPPNQPLITPFPPLHWEAHCKLQSNQQQKIDICDKW